MVSTSLELAASASLGTVVPDTFEERPRYAALRTLAAGRGDFPKQMLLTRARCEGEAHRRARPVDDEPVAGLAG